MSVGAATEHEIPSVAGAMDGIGRGDRIRPDGDQMRLVRMSVVPRSIPTLAFPTPSSRLHLPHLIDSLLQRRILRLDHLLIRFISAHDRDHLDHLTI